MVREKGGTASSVVDRSPFILRSTSSQRFLVDVITTIDSQNLNRSFRKFHLLEKIKFQSKPPAWDFCLRILRCDTSDMRTQIDKINRT